MTTADDVVPNATQAMSQFAGFRAGRCAEPPPSIRARPEREEHSHYHERFAGQPSPRSLVFDQWRQSESRLQAEAMLTALLSNLQKFVPRGGAPPSPCATSSPAAPTDHAGPGGAQGQDEALGVEAIPYDLAVLARDGLSPQGAFPMTLMVLNIAAVCTIDILLEEWPEDGAWDILYLPMFAGGKRCIGYAFVNFRTEADAARFFLKWQDRPLSSFPEQRNLHIIKAHVQGFSANVAELRRKSAGRLRSRQCRPIVIKDGQRVDLESA